MRLKGIEVRDYRSIFADDTGGTLMIEPGDGVTTFVGPNNCGKSNVLRAIAVGLDPQREVTEEDVPGPRQFAYPEITLRFKSDGAQEESRAALNAAADYEHSVGIAADATAASRGDVTLRVSFTPSASGTRRDELIVVDGERTPVSDQQHEALDRALTALRQAVQFVLISSGESIESVLAGNFRAILHNVVRERLFAEFESAEGSRLSYISGLKENLLAPLRERLRAEVAELFPEIGAIELTPDVHTIEHTLANVAVSLDDVVRTPLAGKGTGVRGGLLVAMLSYLATNATRDMIFALEEPEAFLHPGAQEQLRDSLDALATMPGVSLFVTTHSPFTLTRSPLGQIVCLAKDRDGRTRVSEAVAGDADHAPLVAGLLREQTLEDVLHASSAIPAGTAGVVMVEGDGDRFCLELAATVVGRPDLLDGVWIRPTGGTMRMAMHAIVARAAHPDLPLVIVVDNDEPGRHVRTELIGNTFKFEKKQIITYASLFAGDKWQQFPVEAEDLFAPSLIQRFVDLHGTSVIDGSRKRPDDAFHYDLGPSAKLDLEMFLEAETTAQDVSAWIELILRVRSLLGLPEVGTVDEITAEAPDRAAATAGDAGHALIVTGAHDHATYGLHSAVLLAPEQPVPDDVTHVGFYANGEIHPVFPAIVANHPRILIADETCVQLRQTGRAVDAQVANVIQSIVRAGTITGEAHRLLVLTAPGDPSTLELDRPITNTKTHNGRPLAWTVGSRVITVASLRTNPTTTDELDARQHQEDQR